VLWQAIDPLAGTVDLYYADMDDPALNASAFMPLLSPDDVTRAERFRFDLHRRRFIVGRGALRSLLADLTGCAPAELTLIAGPEGKPSLAAGPSFNLSHSEQHLLIGITAEGRLGVDIEVKKPIPDAMELARTHFTEEEIAALRGLSAEELGAAFLRIWTRKESLLKALGTGLSLPLDRVSMKVDTGQGNLLQSSRVQAIDPLLWCVRSPHPHVDFEAAVALDKPDFTHRFLPPRTKLS
jgi:4'-phosphopantetheinyl transferase